MGLSPIGSLERRVVPQTNQCLMSPKPHPQRPLVAFPAQPLREASVLACSGPDSDPCSPSVPKRREVFLLGEQQKAIEGPLAVP